MDDDAPSFSVEPFDMERTMLVGDTIVIAFSNLVVTLVVDQSGSMTWNDHAGLRFSFLKTYIDDIETLVAAAGKTASYSIVKFNSRQIGLMSVSLQTPTSAASSLAGVRIVRKVGSPPSNASDGIIVFEGLGQQIRDPGLTTGTRYYYGAYTFDAAGHFSPDGRIDYAQPSSSPTPPLGVAGLTAKEVIAAGTDIGKRTVKLSWSNPSGYAYTTVTLVRRDDRPPTYPGDVQFNGTVLLASVAASTTTFTDFSLPMNPINGLTYYYAVFTEQGGLKCYQENAAAARVKITTVDRTWERTPPFTPPVGFDVLVPGTPTSPVATPGDSEVSLTWVAADAESVRFRVFYGQTQYPRQMNFANGANEYDGEVVFDGTATNFVHRGLVNGQPHYYVLVAMNQVGTQSVPAMLPITRPQAGLSTSIPPPPAVNLSAEVLNSTTNVLTFSLPLSTDTAVDAFFGDTIRAIATVSFLDSDPNQTSATFSFVEVSRKTTPLDETVVVDPLSALTLANTPSPGATSVTAVATSTPFLSIQNTLDSVNVKMHASLGVYNRGSGSLIQEVITKDVSVTFHNPFVVSISNDPAQMVSTRTWKTTCSDQDNPGYDIGQVPGVYVLTGEPFYVTLEASYRGQALDNDITLAMAILDKATGLPSTSVVLPQTNADGIAVFTTATVADETLDRSGQPSGQSVNKSKVSFVIPPQNVPGEYILQVVGTYLGYARSTTLEMHFEPSLNIDVDSLSFSPNGVDIAEQKAFVYLGAFDAPPEGKNPVTDLTVTDWKITLLGGDAKKKARPFFAKPPLPSDIVPGTGVKAYTRSGIARYVFFGPGTDVEPPKNVICTDGEIYDLSCTVKYSGMTSVGHALVELLPYSAQKDLNRIFLRLSRTQPDASMANTISSSVLFADGIHEARFEVLADPAQDTGTGPGDVNSGLYFFDNLTAAGGVAPSTGSPVAPLEDGRIITMSARALSGGVNLNNLIIKTNLSPDGQSAYAKAVVSGGKAVFTVSLNALVVGKTLEPPLPGEGPQNPVYGDSSSLTWETSPVVVSLSVFTVLEVNGAPVVFSGGGGSLGDSTPPAFISMQEPLI